MSRFRLIRPRARALGTAALLGSLSLVAGAMRAPAQTMPAPCGGAPLVVAVLAGIFAANGAVADVNGDERLGAADLVATALLGVAPACPQGTAAVQLVVANRSDRPQVTGTLRGRRLQCDCVADDQEVEFERSFVCLGTAARPCAEVGGLAPGEWLLEFRIDEPDRGQVQYRRVRLVADDEPVRTEWTAFASVLVVDDRDNTGIGSLRNRLQLVRNEAKPALIRFDDGVFPAGELTLVDITFPLTTLDSDDVTIDGIDALGLAANRGVDAQGLPFGAFSVSGAGNHILGLRLRGAGGEDRDVVQVAGETADGNLLEQLVVEGPASGDGIGIDDGAGSDFGGSATVVRGCEVRGASDKGIKVTGGAFARIEDSHVYDNDNGGVQATLGGHVLVVDSLVEDNAGIGGENGFAVQGLDEVDALSTLTSIGNVVRRNDGNGLSVRAFATAVVADTALIENGTGGVRVFNDVGTSAFAVVEGSAMACNRLDGVVVLDDSLADLGGGPFASAGGNAFAFNGEPDLGFDLRSASSAAIDARFAQWGGCGRGVVCDEEALLASDVRDVGGGVAIAPAVAPAGLGVPVVTRVEPARGRAGDLVRIFGAGFDAVAGYGDGGCEALAEANGCAPVRGNCVTIGGAAAEVVAVTPTMLVVRRPFSCLEPEVLRVSVMRADRPATSEPIVVCGAGEG